MLKKIKQKIKDTLRRKTRAKKVAGAEESANATANASSKAATNKTAKKKVTKKKSAPKKAAKKTVKKKAVRSAHRLVMAISQRRVVAGIIVAQTKAVLPRMLKRRIQNQLLLKRRHRRDAAERKRVITRMTTIRLRRISHPGKNQTRIEFPRKNHPEVSQARVRLPEVDARSSIRKQSLKQSAMRIRSPVVPCCWRPSTSMA